jgi:polygalacturonase
MFETMISRRTFVSTAAGAACTLAFGDSFDWRSQASAILARVKPPQFPNRDFLMTTYGAKPGSDATDPIRKAIEACSAAGGGRVIVPRGEFVTGAIRLKSNVNLHLDEGATLKFSRDPKDYPTVFTRFEGVECMNYSPFLYAFEQSNIAITGTGTLDGQAYKEHWWPWKQKGEDRNRLFEAGAKGIPVAERVFGQGHTLRPNFIQPYRCQNVLIEGVTIRNSPMWEIHPVLSRNVTVRNVSINSHGPNNDGCDPESCADVLIDGCTFDTGDDCIAIKSGRNADGRRVNKPCENLLIQNCNMKDGHGGVSIGSESSGGVRNVIVRDCKMSGPNLQRALRIKTNSYRGGVTENIAFHNVTVGEVANDVIQLDYFYEEGPGGPFHPMIRNIDIGEVTCEKAQYALNFRGYESDPIFEVSISNCKFNGASKPPLIENVRGLRASGVEVNGKTWNP